VIGSGLAFSTARREGGIFLRREDPVAAALLREVTRYDIGWYFYQVKFKRLPIM
jgi:hypothetical protein